MKKKKVKSEFSCSLVYIIDMVVDEYYSDLEKRTKELSKSALNNALSGYDIVNGEPYNCLEGNNEDPGLKHQIFKRGKHIVVTKVTTCAMKLQSTVITTLNQFRSATGSSSVEGEGFGFKQSGEVSLTDPSGSAGISADWEVCHWRSVILAGIQSWLGSVVFSCPESFHHF